MVKKQIADFGIRKALGMLRTDSDKAIPRLLDAMDLVARGSMPSQRRVIRENLEDKDSNV